MKSDVTGMISIAAFMGSCLLLLLSVTPRKILTGDVATDAGQFLGISVARRRRCCPAAVLSGALDYEAWRACITAGGRRSGRRRLPTCCGYRWNRSTVTRRQDCPGFLHKSS